MGGEETWPYVVDRLKPLRERGYLTYFNGTARVERPITVVATGNAPFHLISANASYRDVFYDAPLARLPSLSPEEREQLASPNLLNALKNNSLVAASGPPPTQPYHLTNSYYASTSFRKAVGITWSLHLTESQVDRIRAHVDAAHERGLLVRYWSAPSFPRSLRNSIWRTMIKEGVDMLNTDDLVAATTRDWGWKGKWAWRADEAKAVNGQTASANPDKEATSS
ncbi:Altered inheritance of mitochondria protein 6 [Ascosphaera atra]|nr:Altered inheritance of mitochondria protein 6 [Ascosphaera atra]